MTVNYNKMKKTELVAQARYMERIIEEKSSAIHDLREAIEVLDVKNQTLVKKLEEKS